jgi:2-polyprenyl-3-methyl-5-hydroxy-6-metoxy-1,4-benzoquinol methylase
VGNFSLEWTRHRLTQLDDATHHESEERFRIKTGFAPDDLKGKLVLDVGCGAGRFSEVALRWGATVVGIDLSLAVDSAYVNLDSRSQFHVALADIFRLPFKSESFDVIFSLGVLHHTPDTAQAFRQVATPAEARWCHRDLGV